MSSHSLLSMSSSLPALAIPAEYGYSDVVASDLQKAAQTIYRNCLLHAKACVGELYLTFDYDLSRKKIALQTADGLKELTRITTSSYVDVTNGKCVTREWTFIGESFKETRHTLSDGALLPQECFHGNEVEKRAYLTSILSTGCVAAYWNNVEGPDGVSKEEVEVFKTQIHPRIVSSLATITQHHPRKITIVDIGGGRAKLAEKILDTLADKIEKLVVLDKSASAIQQARKIAREFPEKLKTKQMDVVTDDLTEMADVIIMSGFMQHTVLNLPQAQSALLKSLRCLRDGGYFIIASQANAIFHAYDFEQVGLRVLNRTFFQATSNGKFNHWITHNFYILQKPQLALQTA